MNEKMKILKMLEDGQITAAEATQLLAALDGKPAPVSSPPPVPQHSVPTPPPVPRSYTEHPGSNNGHSRVATDFSKKFDGFTRDIGPTMHRVIEAVAGRIDDAASRVASAFATDDYHHPTPQTSTPRPKHTPVGAVTTQNIEMLVEVGGYNELSLSGINGEIRIKGYNGDKITAKLSYRTKKPSAKIELVKLGGKYFLKYESDEFHSVGIDAYVPERAFGIIKIDGINTFVDCSSLAATEIHISNSNGILRLDHLRADNVVADSTNGTFTVSNIVAKTATFENINGIMDISEVDVAKLKVANHNFPLAVIMSKFECHMEYEWSVETANGKLNMNLPTLPTLGYHIKAHAAMGEIRLGLTGLQFLINEPSLVEARSVSFDTARHKVKMMAETSNASLNIN